jgi:hypothetical protein
MWNPSLENTLQPDRTNETGSILRRVPAVIAAEEKH